MSPEERCNGMHSCFDVMKSKGEGEQKHCWRKQEKNYKLHRKVKVKVDAMKSKEEGAEERTFCWRKQKLVSRLISLLIYLIPFLIYWPSQAENTTENLLPNCIEAI